MNIEERLQRLEQAIRFEERLSRIEYKSIRVTIFLLLEIGLLALIAWSIFHLLRFVRSSAF